MRIAPGKLMPLLGSSGDGRGNWSCPLHPDPDRCLSVSEGVVAEFSCGNPVCRFRGDAISLVSLARKIPVEETLRLFMDGGELAGCADVPLTSEDAEAYVGAYNTQMVLKAYLAKARAALRAFPERSGICAGMCRSNVKALHPCVGVFVPDGKVPKCLLEFTKKAYAKSNLVLYPYTSYGEVTKIDVVDTNDSGFRRTVVVSHPRAGVFGEEFAEGAKKLIAVESPETAAELYARHMSATRAPFRCVAFQHYPLPSAFKDVTVIDLVSTKKSVVSTRMLLRTLSAPEIKPGRAPQIRVIETGGIDDIPASAFEAGYMGGAWGMGDLQYVVARRFSRLVAGGKAKEIAETLNAEQVPPVVRTLVKGAAETALARRGGFNGDEKSTQEAIDILAGAVDVPSCDALLANGRIVRLDTDGVYAVKPDGSIDTLCNVGLAVCARVASESADMSRVEAFECTVSARGDFPALKMRLGWKDLTADRLRSAVQAAYAERGLSPYVAFYSFPNFSWRDIMSKLAENCQVERVRPIIELKKPVEGGSLKLGPITR